MTANTLVDLHGYDQTRLIRNTDDTGHSILIRQLGESAGSVASRRFRNQRRILTVLNGSGCPCLLPSETEDSDRILRLTDNGYQPLKTGHRWNRQISRFLMAARAMTEALRRIHDRHVVHRALCPEAFLLCEQLSAAQLVDFTMATEVPEGNPEIKEFALLPLQLPYMAPEQSGRMNRAVDNRSDLYSLGAIFYQMLSGEPPFGNTEERLSMCHAHIARVPRPLNQNDPQIPVFLARIVDKLLAKSADERYQSAAGLLQELTNCQQRLEDLENGVEFQPGTSDVPDRLHIAQKLYGRETEIAELMSTFERCADGRAEVMMVSGYSGIGKSALIGELCQPMTARSGYFLAGKFDQFQRDQPYSALSQAFGDMICQLLAEPESRLLHWRALILEAAGPNGRVLTDVLPDLKKLIGPQPDLPALGPEETLNRFNRVFLRFLHAIADLRHPLVLFIDDLQWVDIATLQLLKLFITDPDSHHFLFLGAYRDNEVDSGHPLMSLLNEIRNSEVRVGELTLQPLPEPHLNQLIADSLHLSNQQTRSLATIVHAKTDGNPFFSIQFLRELNQRSLLHFNSEAARWQWSEPAIRQQQITRNVVDLMIARIGRLPEATRNLLQLAACIGASFDLTTLARIAGLDLFQLAAILWPAVSQGLLIPESEEHSLLLAGDMDGSVAGDISSDRVRERFLHDRVQQAAYAMLDNEQQTRTHLKTGRLLLATARAGELEERCFEIAGHLNLSRALITDEQELLALARLNLKAARRAMNSTAYRPATDYLQSAISCLGDDPWQQHHQLSRDISLALIECLYLLTELEQAARQVSIHRNHCSDPEEQIALNTLLITQYTRIGRLPDAIDQALEALDLLNAPLPASPSMDDIGEGIADIQQALQHRSFPELARQPDTDDPKVLQIMEVLMAMQPCTYNSGSLLFPLTILSLLKLTMTHGNSRLSAYVYMMYALMCTKVLKDYPTAFEAAACADQLHRSRPNPELTGRHYMMYANFVLGWQRHLTEVTSVRRLAYEHCLDLGDYYWGVHACIFGFFGELLETGQLADLSSRTEALISTCERMNQPAQVYLCTLQHNLLKILQGEMPNRHDLNHLPGFEQQALENYDTHSYMCGKYDRLLCRLLLGYLFGNYQQGLDIALRPDLGPEELDEGIFHEAFYILFNCLSILALKQQGADWSAEQRHRYEQFLKQGMARLTVWAGHCPDNFAAALALTEAEAAAADGRFGDATEGYERAFSAAEQSGYALYLALCNERCGLNWQRRGNQELAAHYLEKARQHYRHWGATGKADTLSHHCPRTSAAEPEPVPLDLEAVIHASQTLSGEIVLSELLQKMMTLVMETAGAETAALYLPEDDRWTMLAQRDNHHFRVSDTISMADSDSDISVLDQLLTAGRRPDSLLNYVSRNQQALVLDNASTEGVFIGDRYIRQYQPVSLLCLPLVDRGQTRAVLHLENNLTSHVFTEERVRVLQLLSSQIVISLQNARLYGDLQYHKEQLQALVEKRTRQLNERNKRLEKILSTLPTPFLITRPDGRVHEFNQPLLDLLQLTEPEIRHSNALSFYRLEDQRNHMLQSLDQHGIMVNQEALMTTSEGREFWAHHSAVLIDLDDEPAIFISMSDISQLKSMEQDLQSILTLSPLPIVISSPDSGEVLYANERSGRLFNLPGPGLEIPRAMDYWVDLNDREELMSRLSRQKRVINYEALLQDSDGNRFWSLISAVPLTFRQRNAILATFTDISKHKKTEAKLSHLASTDSLTGCLNRHAFLQMAAEERQVMREQQICSSLIFLDIDHFKHINDTYGHSVGDIALRHFVRTVRQCLRTDDVFCRLGGEEFALLLPRTGMPEAMQIAERIRNRISVRDCPLDDDNSLPMTVSAGVSEWQPDMALDSVLREADEKMYRAKQAGRNQVVGD